MDINKLLEQAIDGRFKVGESVFAIITDDDNQCPTVTKAVIEEYNLTINKSGLSSFMYQVVCNEGYRKVYSVEHGALFKTEREADNTLNQIEDNLRALDIPLVQENCDIWFVGFDLNKKIKPIEGEIQLIHFDFNERGVLYFYEVGCFKNKSGGWDSVQPVDVDLVFDCKVKAQQACDRINSKVRVI